MARIVTAEELLDGHSVLDIECLDRVYLNAYVPALQSSGQVVAFMTQHLGQADPVAGADGADRDAVPQGSGVLRGRERDPLGEVREGRPQDRRDAAAHRGAGRHREVSCGKVGIGIYEESLAEG
jgi:hypothetical protein